MICTEVHDVGVQGRRGVDVSWNQRARSHHGAATAGGRRCNHQGRRGRHCIPRHARPESARESDAAAQQDDAHGLVESAHRGHDAGRRDRAQRLEARRHDAFATAGGPRPGRGGPEPRRISESPEHRQRGPTPRRNDGADAAGEQPDTIRPRRVLSCGSRYAIGDRPMDAPIRRTPPRDQRHARRT